MNTDFIVINDPRQLWFAGFTFVASLIIAFLFDKVLLKRFIKIAQTTEWEGDDILFSALKKSSFYLIASIGLYFSILELPFSEPLSSRLLNVVMGIMVLVITIITARIAVGFVKVLPGKSEGNFPGSSIFINVTRITIYVLGFVFLLQQLGISITPIITALGVGGLAVALALQDTLANLFAGLNVIAGRKLQQGDYIQLESGQEGVIIDINWRSTIIQEVSANSIIVPNTKMASSIIKNYSSPDYDMIVTVPVGVSYSSDLEQVERIVQETGNSVMRNSKGGVPEFQTLLRYKAFGDFSVNFDVLLKANAFTERLTIRHEFIKLLYRRFKEEGIEIPFPIQTIHLKKD